MTFKVFLVLVRILWRQFIRHLDYIVRIFSPSRIIGTIQLYKERRILAVQGDRRKKIHRSIEKIHRSIVGSFLFDLKSCPSKYYIYLYRYIFFYVQYKFIIIMFQNGYWSTARATILMLMLRYKNNTDYLYGLSLYLLINYYNTLTRWTIEYAPYSNSGIFLSPDSITKKCRFLGNQKHLTHKLRRLNNNAYKHAYYSCQQLLFECLDVAPLIETEKGFKNTKAFLDDHYSIYGIPNETLKSISTMLLNKNQNDDDQNAFNNCQLILSRLLDYSNTKCAIYKKEGFNRLFNPKAQKPFDAEDLISEQEFTIHYDIFYQGLRKRHMSSLLYQSIQIHHFRDINLCDGGLLLSENKAYTQFVHVGDIYLPLFSRNILINGKNRLVAFKSKQPKTITGVSAYCGYSDNYYHWLIECIPRFILFKKWAELHNIKPLYLLTQKPKKWQVQSLSYIGITPEECLFNKFNTGFYCEELLTVDLPSYDMQSHPMTLKILKQGLPTDWFEISPHPSKKLFLTRKRSGLQRLGNSGQVAAILKRYGYENVFPELLSLREQISLFSSATHVVGIGGAAITNCLFMPPNSKVLIFGPIDQIQPGTFSPMLEAAGLHVAYIACDSLPTVNRNYIGTVFNYEINLKDLVDILNIAEA